MENHQETIKKKGIYLGIEINETWWKWCMKDTLLMKGNGKYWHDGSSFNSLRNLTNTPIETPFSAIKELKIGSRHSGKWLFGYPILKIKYTVNGNYYSTFLRRYNGKNYYSPSRD